MFSLIITVISIALVAALAVASVYYGGPALSKGTSRAAAATVVSQGQQIAGAATMLASDSAMAVGAAFVNLTDNNYLTSIPTPPNAVGTSWEVGALAAAGFATVASTSKDICIEVEKNRDSSVTETSFDTKASVDLIGAFGTDDIAADYAGQFGCLSNTANDAYVVYYSL